MRHLSGRSIVALLAVALSAASVRADDVAKPELIIKPRPPVAAPSAFTVETKPQFPKADSGDASDRAESQGLSIVVRPEKKEFAANGPYSLEVVLKNETEKPFMLYRPGILGGDAKLVVTHQKTGSQWTLESTKVPIPGHGSEVLKPGESRTLYAVVPAVAFRPAPPIRPFPPIRPLPHPAPVPLPRPLKKPQVVPNKAKAGVDEKPDAVKEPGVRIAPPIIATPASQIFRQGECKAIVTVEFGLNPARARIRFAHPHWSGKLASRPVSFEVGKPQPVVGPVPPVLPRPPIVPPPGGPLSKEQAVKIAVSSAERALDASYKPLDPVRPVHNGKWIENAEKSADAKKQKDGTWRVSWTHFSKGRGFRYNVAVDVGPGRGAVVKEVFTAWSPR